MNEKAESLVIVSSDKILEKTIPYLELSNKNQSIVDDAIKELCASIIEYETEIVAGNPFLLKTSKLRMFGAKMASEERSDRDAARRLNGMALIGDSVALARDDARAFERLDFEGELSRIKDSVKTYKLMADQVKNTNEKRAADKSDMAAPYVSKRVRMGAEKQEVQKYDQVETRHPVPWGVIIGGVAAGLAMIVILSI